MSEGLDEQGLAELHHALDVHVEQGALPGLVALVARGGQTWIDVIGTRSFDDIEPLRTDDIFRIASLSKPMAATVAMMLVDDGTLALDQPVDRWLPELADRQVLRAPDAELDDTVPAERAITIEDLLSFRLGMGCVTEAPGTAPIQVAEQAMQLRTFGPPWPPTPHTSDRWIELLATLPLMEHPGTRWRYNTGAQVLGVLLERAADQPLRELLAERLCEPLGMADTDFFVPEEKWDRFTTAYVPDATGAPEVFDRPASSWWGSAPLLPNAAGMLVSTIEDFWSFVRLLLDHGVRDGERLLSERSIELLTTDRLTAEQRRDASVFLGHHSGWGLGMAAPATGVERVLDPAEPVGFGWDGGSGTTWRTDPAVGLTGILFTQRQLTSPEPPDIFRDFWTGARTAVAT